MQDTEIVIDKKGFIEWLETMSSHAFNDLSESIDEGNIEAAKANLERIRMLENIAPWIGEKNCFLGIRLIGKQTQLKIKDVSFFDEKLPF